MKTALVVVAAGSGTRFGGPKQFMPLNGKPLLAHSLKTLDEMLDFSSRIVVLPAGMKDSSVWLSIVGELSHPIVTVDGGSERRDSVLAGIQATPEDYDLVAVHDGARPFIPVVALKQCINSLEDDLSLAGAIVASRVVDTVKQVGENQQIRATVDRKGVLRAETPQVCRRELLLAALMQLDENVTDEAQALELTGHHVQCIVHDGYNVKVTNKSDLVLAEAWMQHNAQGGTQTCYRSEVDE